MSLIQIFNRVDRSVIFSHECENNTLVKTLEHAISACVDLRYADLCYFELHGADLRNANLSDADLSFADLRGADLSNADLRFANLRGADLNDADLCFANLQGAILRSANLHNANLRSTFLRRADTYGANLHMVRGVYCACPTEGEFIGWKKADSFIVKLLIPADALRSSALGTKCRCNKAFVLDIQNVDGSPANVHVARSDFSSTFAYVRNSWVEVKDFDTNRWNECAPGIHFFVDRREAVEY